MAEQDYSVEQGSLREATQQYIELLPAAHRGLLRLMAEDYKKPAHALIAGAIEQLIRDWTQEVMPEAQDRRPFPVRRSA